MAKFNFWRFKQRFDDYFYEVINITLRTLFFVKSLDGRYDFLKKNIEVKSILKDQRVFVVANGPSINSQDLKPLKFETSFFVNRSFLHKDYSYIQPTFHVIVDSKLATGEWDLTFLDEILQINPNVTFLLNAKWFHMEKFKPYIQDPKFKIYWVETNLFTTPFHRFRKLDLTKLTYGSAVAGAATTSAIYMGTKEIYFLGQDGNGLCYELTDGDSHFYGGNPENKKKDMTDIFGDLYMMSLALKNWCYFSDYCDRIGVKIYNCTAGGIFNMFERKTYESVISDK